MPKLLPHLRDKLLSEAASQLHGEGYAALSIRALASRCEVATGTIYNYFKSKDDLVAQIIMVDWHAAVAAIACAADEADNLPAGLSRMYGALDAFVQRYRSTWEAFAQSGGASSPLVTNHRLLRDQLTEPIARLTSRCCSDLLPLAPLLAETLLICAVQPDLDDKSLRLLAERIAIDPSHQQQEETP